MKRLLHNFYMIKNLKSLLKNDTNNSISSNEKNCKYKQSIVKKTIIYFLRSTNFYKMLKINLNVQKEHTTCPSDNYNYF